MDAERPPPAAGPSGGVRASHGGGLKSHRHFLVSGLGSIMDELNLPGAAEAWPKVFFRDAMRPTSPTGTSDRRSGYTPPERRGTLLR